MEKSIASVIASVLVIALTVVFIVSFALFIRRIILHASSKKEYLATISRKLDRIIELMEKQKS
ncbi:DUF4083 family protein [Marinicrinis lubricantis]|uniref:DUF4083 family protein n=1 Tax=Marinicrinis lubricantis TaxID=2086470 RepID=A0ABW1ILN4_9BACL